ncbi:unnamed protein product, partial [Prorocentrum cordatum]
EQPAPAGEPSPAGARAPFGALQSVLVNVLLTILVLFMVLVCTGELAPAGNASASSGTCEQADGCAYTRCEMRRDLRAVASFLLGAALCSVISRVRGGESESAAGKMSLSHCVL